MRLRSIASAAFLVALIAPSASPAAAPCTVDATLCVAATNPAECRSVAVVTSTKTAVSEAVATLAQQSRSADTHVAEVSRPDGVSVGWVHAGGVESWCQAYIAGGLRKACGRAAIDELVISLYPTVPLAITVRGFLEEGCTSAGTGSGGFNFLAFEQIVVTTATGTFGIAPGPPPNAAIPLGVGTLYLNERFVGTGSCLQNQGSGLRLETGSSNIIVGWVSTSACS